MCKTTEGSALHPPNPISASSATAHLKGRYPDITIIGLSVNAGEENQKAMKKAGGTTLITKEAAVEQLYAVIQETFYRRAADVELPR